MKKRVHAFWTLGIVLLTAHLVTASWVAYQSYRLLAEFNSRGPEAKLAERIDQVTARIKSGELQLSNPQDARFVSAVLALQAKRLREEPHKYDFEILSSRGLFHTSVVVFTIQLLLAFSGFFVRFGSAQNPKPSGVPSNSP